MNSITRKGFQDWLEAYGRASQENDPQASAELFAPDAEYYESPFSEPMVGREAIFRYWDAGARNLKDKMSTYEILALEENLGVAHWRAHFLNTRKGQHVALDCLFLVEFDENQKCRRFREWWHSQVMETGRTAAPSFLMIL